MTTNQQIRKFIAETGMSERKFAESLEIDPSQLNRWLSGKHSPTYKTVAKIRKRHPTFPDFEISGEENTSTLVHDMGKQIPYYDIEATAGDIALFTDSNETPSSYFNIPAFSDCNFGINVYGHSMYPKITNGDIILCREVAGREFINFGEIYLIVTKEQRMIKYLKKHTDKTFVKLVSENKEFDDIELPVESILKLYLVKGTIKRNQI